MFALLKTRQNTTPTNASLYNLDRWNSRGLNKALLRGGLGGGLLVGSSNLKRFYGRSLALQAKKGVKKDKPGIVKKDLKSSPSKGKKAKKDEKVEDITENWKAFMQNPEKALEKDFGIAPEARAPSQVLWPNTQETQLQKRTKTPEGSVPSQNQSPPPPKQPQPQAQPQGQPVRGQGDVGSAKRQMAQDIMSQIHSDKVKSGKAPGIAQMIKQTRQQPLPQKKFVHYVPPVKPNAKGKKEDPSEDENFSFSEDWGEGFPAENVTKKKDAKEPPKVTVKDKKKKSKLKSKVAKGPKEKDEKEKKEDWDLDDLEPRPSKMDLPFNTTAYEDIPLPSQVSTSREIQPLKEQGLEVQDEKALFDAELESDLMATFETQYKTPQVITPPPPPQIIFPRELDHSQAGKVLSDAVKDKTPEELFTTKFEKTITEERYQEIVKETTTLSQILLMPHKQTGIIKKERVSIQDDEIELSAYFRRHKREGFSYNRYIRGVAERGRFDLGLMAILDMKLRGFKPNIYHYNSLFVSLVKQPHANQQEKIEHVLSLIRSETQPDVWTYSIMIDSILAGSPSKLIPDEIVDKAFDVIELMKKEDIKPNVPIFTSLVKGCIRAKDTVRAWATFDHMRVWHHQPDVVMYSSMIHVCSKTGEAERALNLYEEMKSNDLYPTEITFNSLISCFIKRYDMHKDAFRILTEMKNFGYIPNAKTYCHLLKVCAKGGDLQTSQLLFDELMRLPDQSDRAFPYGALIESFANNHRVVGPSGYEKNIKDAEQVFEKMVSAGISPSVPVMNALLKVYTEAMRFNRSNALKEKYAEYGLTPDSETYKTLIKMNCRARKLEKAMDLFQIMKTKALKPDLQVYAYLIMGCTKTFSINSGINLLKEMKENGIQPKPHHLFVLNFRRDIMKHPHLVRQVDKITGRANQHRPFFLQPGFRKVRAQMREIPKEEQKLIEKEPKFLTPSQLA
eukprot:TRINITY_DN2481_c0_g1_i1.p1 TRINITY_DN2481_c0_g1~~TRINITY_DN2481_c0_g1_i1.p1  ORF type:complete len:986 (-),score=264.69 TRINITY_DN2481_c0_g1_i1:1247-4120(-)